MSGKGIFEDAANEVFNIPPYEVAISIQHSLDIFDGAFATAGFNEYGVSVSTTVSASTKPNKIKKWIPSKGWPRKSRLDEISFSLV